MAFARSISRETLSSALVNEGVLSVSIIVCYQHLNIYGSSGFVANTPEINREPLSFKEHETLSVRRNRRATIIRIVEHLSHTSYFRE